MLLESIMYEIETMGKQARMWETRQEPGWRSCCHLKSERCRHRARPMLKPGYVHATCLAPAPSEFEARRRSLPLLSPKFVPPDFPGAQDSACSG